MRRLLMLLLILLLAAGCRGTTSSPEPDSPMRFAFVRGGDLWLWEGGEERRLTKGAPVDSPRFSPTGRFILYTQGGQLKLTGAGGRGPWTIPDADLTARRPADWHPSDDRLAITRSLGGEPSIWVYRVNAENGPEQDGMTISGWSDPLWTPDGQSLTISRIVTQPGNPHVGTAYTATIAPAHGEPDLLLADPFAPNSTAEALQERCGKGAIPQAWSADGEYLLLVRPGWTSSIAADCNDWLLLDPATGMTEQLGASPDLRWAVWSPTEPVLAYVHGPDREPAWSPGGHYLAFVRSMSQGMPPSADQAIYLVEVETGSTRRIRASEGGLGPFWGREGTLFWFTTGAPAAGPRPGSPKASARSRPTAHLRHGRRDLPSPLLTLDQPPYYYGQWDWPRVLDSWIPPLPYSRP